MGEFAVLLILLAIGLVFLTVGASWLVNRISAATIGEKHRNLETIISTREPPASWVAPYAKDLTKLRDGPEREARTRDLQERAKVSYLLKLERLIEYGRTTPFIVDDETREALLGELEEIRRIWRERAAQTFPINPR